MIDVEAWGKEPPSPTPVWWPKITIKSGRFYLSLSRKVGASAFTPVIMRETDWRTMYAARQAKRPIEYWWACTYLVDVTENLVIASDRVRRDIKDAKISAWTWLFRHAVIRVRENHWDKSFTLVHPGDMVRLKWTGKVLVVYDDPNPPRRKEAETDSDF